MSHPPDLSAGPETPAPAPRLPPPPSQPAYPLALEPPDPQAAADGVDHPPASAEAPAAAAPSAAAPSAAAPPAGGAAGTGGLPPARRAVPVVLSVVAAVALLAAGVLGYLWWDTDRELADLREQHTAEVAELTEEGAAQETTIDNLERSLESVRDRLAIAERDLEGAENMVELLQDEQGVIRRCVTLHGEVLDAIIAGDEAAFNAAVDEAEEVCDEADRILAS